MAADYDRISKWICRRPDEATHMLVVCDTFDYDDYPVYFPSELNEPSDMPLADVYAAYNGSNMQKVMEVYSFTGKHSIEEQLAERRAVHFD